MVFFFYFFFFGGGGGGGHRYMKPPSLHKNNSPKERGGFRLMIQKIWVMVTKFLGF